jgi:dipeptidyl aminopeptidase/acylaminoacyl peptidase
MNSGSIWSARLAWVVATVPVAASWAQIAVGQKAVRPEDAKVEVAAIQGITRGRAMVPRDLLSIRKYGAIRTSPDGKTIALEIRRWAPGTWKENGNVLGNINQRAELWIVSRIGGIRRKLTPEQPIQLSQWNPIWSPDSEQLAFLSNEGQGNAFLEVWDRASGRIRRLTSLGVDLAAQISKTNARADEGQMVWLDDSHLIVALYPQGSRSPRFDVFSRSAMIASAGVSAAAGGTRATAVVASSPPDRVNIKNLPQAQLTVINTKGKATSRVVGEVPVWQSIQGQRFIVISRNGDWAAVVTKIAPGAIDAREKMSPRQFGWAKLGIVSLRAYVRRVRWVEGLQPALVNGMSVTLSWQNGDTSFVIVGQQPGASKPLFVDAVDASSGTWHSIAALDENRLGSDEQMVVGNIAWLKDGRVAVRVVNPRETQDKARVTWWAVDGESATRLSAEEASSLDDSRQPGASDNLQLQTSEMGRLYETDSRGHETTIFPDLNPQLASIEAPKSTNFEYKGASGETLHATLLLPNGYVQGKRYPTVVWVYAGDIYSGNEKPPTRADNGFLNPMLLTGRGYAVLKPSMPLTSAGIPGDPMLHLNDGVDPAVDQAIALGVVDRDRLALMGHSYGGYSVFGLLTQTNRYHAGIGMMGISDLMAWYTEFDPTSRYTDPDYAASAGPWWTEWEAGRMGVPLWVDPERYLRNSPVLAADKIRTPLLIFSGDLDSISSRQSEAMFTILHRQGKRAEYVRYLGEQHSLGSPANILDMWQRVFTWLDIYVKNPEVGEK